MAFKINRKMIWITLLIVSLVVFSLAFTKFEIREEIEINASAEKVWQTVIDFPNYKNWNTQLSFLGGEVKPNGKLHLKLSVEGTNPYEFKPIISHWQENEKFAWLAQTGLPRVFDGEHFFEINKLENGKTLLINREEYRGILSLLMKTLPMMKDAPKGFKKMNLEFKNYIETNNQNY